MKNRGFTVGELLISILLIGIIMSGAIASYKNNNKNRDIDQLIENILITKNNIKDHFINEMSYLNISDSYSVRNNLVSASWQTGDDNYPCVTERGRRCKTRVLDSGKFPAGMNREDGFSIRIRDIPADYCLSLVKKLYPYFEHIEMNVTTFKSHDISYSESATQVLCDELHSEGIPLVRFLVQHF